MEQKELQKIVNPIYTTAKGTIITLAAGGDQNAIALCPYLELEELSGRAPAPESFQKVYAVGQEARFQVYNNAARKRAESVIVDLPSGYSPRGFVMADAGKQYYGLDLPAVIDLMAPAARETMTDAQKQHIEHCAQAVLDARAEHPDATLAQLYDPDNMPANLLAAHQHLDAAVEAAYGVQFDGDEERIVEHLFKLYAQAAADAKK